MFKKMLRKVFGLNKQDSSTPKTSTSQSKASKRIKEQIYSKREQRLDKQQADKRFTPYVRHDVTREQWLSDWEGQRSNRVMAWDGHDERTTRGVKQSGYDDMYDSWNKYNDDIYYYED